MEKKDRLIISNQLKILERLYPEEADDYANYRKAVEHGYTFMYGALYEHLYDELSEDACKFVLDILDMYRAIAFSNSELGIDDQLDQGKIAFPGFDGNNETDLLTFASYYTEDLGRYTELGPTLNSHMPMVQRYQRMLERWQAANDRFKLTKDEIQEILEA